MAGRHYPSIQEFASAIPNHLLLGSLLEHLCFVYESNPTRSRTLFKSTYRDVGLAIDSLFVFIIIINDYLDVIVYLYLTNTCCCFPLTVIGQRLAAMNLLSPLAISDEFSTVRLQHNRAFTELLHAASSSLYQQVTGPLDVLSV